MALLEEWEEKDCEADVYLKQAKEALAAFR